MRSPNLDSPRADSRMHEAAKTFMKLDLPMPVVAKTPMWWSMASLCRATGISSTSREPFLRYPTSMSPITWLRNLNSSFSARATGANLVGRVLDFLKLPSVVYAAQGLGDDAVEDLIVIEELGALHGGIPVAVVVGAVLYVQNAGQKGQALVFDGEDLPHFHPFLLGKVEGHNEMILGNALGDDAVGCISLLYHFSVQQTCPPRWAGSALAIVTTFISPFSSLLFLYHSKFLASSPGCRGSPA